MLPELAQLEQQVTLVRSAGLLLPILAVIFIILLRSTLPDSIQDRMFRFSRQSLAAILLSFIWCLSCLLVLNILFLKVDWWEFNVKGGTFFNVPVDLMIGWAVLWTVIPALLGPRWPPFLWVGLLLLFDILVMPLLTPAVILHPGWLWGEALAIIIALLPALYFFRWTAKQSHLYVRGLLQMILFALLFFFIIPLIILEFSHASPWLELSGSFQKIFLSAQIFLLVSLLGLSALQEFLLRGRGTPFPLDPPRKLVTTGPYAYVSNPMQLTQVFIYLFLAILLKSLWLLLPILVLLSYALGFARFSEKEDMKERFGQSWSRYQKEVKIFIPRWTPYREKAATVYLNLSGCNACVKLGKLIRKLKPHALKIQDARFYPGESLNRITYIDADGFETSGVHALARVMEHINLAWASLGFLMCLPLLALLIQVFVDVIFPPQKVCSITKEKEW